MASPNADPTEEDEVDVFKWENIEEQSRYAVLTLIVNELNGLYDAGLNKKWRDAYITGIAKTLIMSRNVVAGIERVTEASDGLRCDMAPYVEMLAMGARYKEGLQAVLHDILLSSLDKGCYDAQCRVLLAKLAECLGLGGSELIAAEEAVLSVMKTLHEAESEEQKAQREAQKKKARRKKAVMIGVSAVLGAAVIGVTGGLAAPLVAVGAGVLIGSGGAAVLGSAVGIALITTIFTTAGAGLAGYKMNKRLGDVKEFEFREVREKKPSLRSVVCVTGWLDGSDIATDVEACTEQWLCLDEGNEVYGLRWETKELHELGSALSSFVKSTAVNMAVTEALKQTVMASFLSAIAWPMTLLQVASIIDNPWQICINRSEGAGRMLADALLSLKDTRRPVSLVGYGMGARLIFFALLELAKYKGGSGIVQNAYLLGAPIPADSPHYAKLMNDVVAGELVIGYSRSDWVLKFLHRTMTVSASIAGTAPVQYQHPRLVNVDLTDLVTGHHDYVTKLPEVLKTVGLHVRDEVISGGGSGSGDVTDGGNGPDDFLAVSTVGVAAPASRVSTVSLPCDAAVTTSDTAALRSSDSTVSNAASVHSSSTVAGSLDMLLDARATAAVSAAAQSSSKDESTSCATMSAEISADQHQAERHQHHGDLMMSSVIPCIALSSGQQVPQLGFGTYSSVLSVAEMPAAIRDALRTGYRHFDCAPIYDTQAAVGEALGDLASVGSDLTRGDLFVTSKLWNTLHEPCHVRRACTDCIKALQCEYLDLFLMHSPVAMAFNGYDVDGASSIPKNSDGEVEMDTKTRLIDTWRAMEALVDEGLVRSIGVSNFNISHLETLLADSRIPPAVNQIEIHPYCVQIPLVDWCQSRGIAVTAYSPLGAQNGLVKVLEDDVISQLAKHHGVSPAQVCLRWSVQRGIVVIPHSPTVEFMKENLNIFKFTLSDEEIKRISSLDRQQHSLVRDWLTWE